jgi:hypothetical protein
MLSGANKSKERDAAIANLIRMACSEEFKKQVREGGSHARVWPLQQQRALHATGLPVAQLEAWGSP